jgi:4-aminobutyrate aminotransferase / (S)-3-amino-2-methylpropionate transaminase / 5-aminovalerate transaminase
LTGRLDALPEIITKPPGPKSTALAEKLASLESPAVDARREARDLVTIVYERGEGIHVYDVDGNRYVDMAAGFGALALGHGDESVQNAIESQGKKLVLALGDVYASEAKVALCEALVALYPEPGARVLLGSSGADAVTAALKTAVLATGKSGVIAFSGSYHGLSYAPLAALGLHPSFREPFSAQLGRHVTFAPYPQTEGEGEDALIHMQNALITGQIGAVLIEPILGRGGCVVPPPLFLRRVRDLCDRFGALLVCDEIWTGLGRSGSMLMSVSQGVLADIVCVGKALGGGLPVSACIGSAKVMAPWGSKGGATLHTATHFGNPFGCAAALATLSKIRDGGLADRARRVGDDFIELLQTKFANDSRVVAVRGRGLMVGVQFDGAGRALGTMRALLERGWIVLTGGTSGDALTLTPPLTIEPRVLAAFADALASSIV